MPVLTKINSNVIADDAITGDKFSGDAYLSNTATQNITGTYSENRLYTSDAYTLSGNTTVNSNLVLSSVKPNSDIVLTASGAYTLTGTGTLSGGSLLAKQPSLTGMTGEIGSAVTGSPNLNLGNATFSAGHIIQVAYNAENTTVYGGSSSPFVCYCFCDITIKSASSKILIQANPSFYLGNNNLIDVRFLYKTSTGRSATLGDYTGISDTRNGVFGQSQTDDPRNVMANIFLQEQWVHGLSAGAIVNVAISAVRDEGPAGDIHNNRSWVTHEGNITSTMTLWEVVS